MINEKQLEELKRSHPKAKVVCYINSTARIKALSDETRLKIVDIELPQMLEDNKVMPVSLMIPEEDVLAPS